MGIVSYRCCDSALLQAKSVNKTQPYVARIVMALAHRHLQHIPFCIADNFPIADSGVQMQLRSQQLGLADTDYTHPHIGTRRNFKIFFRHFRHVHGLARHLQHRITLP